MCRRLSLLWCSFFRVAAGRCNAHTLHVCYHPGSLSYLCKFTYYSIFYMSIDSAFMPMHALYTAPGAEAESSLFRLHIVARFLGGGGTNRRFAVEVAPATSTRCRPTACKAGRNAPGWCPITSSSSLSTSRCADGASG